jgi:hypothetical protein
MAVRRSRFATRVIHRHQAGNRTMLRVSELTYVGDAPRVLGLCFYGGVTVDPRFIDA